MNPLFDSSTAQAATRFCYDGALDENGQVNQEAALPFKLDDFPIEPMIGDDVTVGELRRLMAHKFPASTPRGVMEGLKYLTHKLCGMPRHAVLAAKRKPMSCGLCITPAAILALRELATIFLGDWTTAPADLADEAFTGASALAKTREKQEIENARQRLARYGYDCPPDVDPRTISNRQLEDLLDQEKRRKELLVQLGIEVPPGVDPRRIDFSTGKVPDAVTTTVVDAAPASVEENRRIADGFRKADLAKMTSTTAAT